MDSCRLTREAQCFVLALDFSSKQSSRYIMSSSEVPGALDGDRSPTIIACVVVLTTFAMGVVSLRFYVRCKMLRSVKSEDWLMLVSMVCSPELTATLRDPSD